MKMADVHTVKFKKSGLKNVTKHVIVVYIPKTIFVRVYHGT